MHARCPFEVVSFEPAEWPEPPREGMRLGRAELRKRFSGGDLEGSSVVQMLSARAGQSAGTYLALEHVSGRLHGRSGTFVVQHGATAHADERADTSWGAVVEGSGTGELAGLRGSCRVVHGLLELDYDLG
ncbi:MAG TPA: DUF3224 domain-containing protein [Solirubrobacteraceae bacterium]|nr:DUF3224 domain-containing protein [Solirubrobacteraceae bacterium]